MHEMSLAEGIRGIVEDVARENGATRVARVVLEIGELASVEVEALRFCLDVVLKDSVADGAAVDIEAVPGSGWCMQCATVVPIAQRYDACPQCGGYQVQPTGGTEMRVKELALGD
ncbi:hydrogenase maturation nickel metallochaperone HypA [Azoarcus olearius]|uniref:Hydrogenase maturation factor HypA n=1 Tax=Azoarcus sp. (strain BH72) TaxID=418699 RepID=HYPA_AZOSB|nr:hydrogenase maturation nickel metallochaperone HypA [Azoarcus olearius]A1KC59.1 RecName: Full=Hydrogenase maturation factor HypA [Azoarcus olearius]ANQ86967.1 hydrogenase nickel inorporation protein hypA [Azoarcus olearius]CAL96415.1 probable hydrogenase nickel inorporation protein hypA [Azoarcus olearius]